MCGQEIAAVGHLSAVSVGSAESGLNTPQSYW